MKSDVLSLVTVLSNGQADATISERLYRDIVYDLGKKPLLTKASLVAAAVGTAVYNFPTDAVTLLDVYWDDTELDAPQLRELESLDPEWRSRKGVPLAHITEEEAPLTFRVYPIPDRPSKVLIPTHGAPFGLDYPGEGFVVVHTERRDDLPVWLEVPVAFLILEREFSRESNHRDPLFSLVCREIATLLMRFVERG